MMNKYPNWFSPHLHEFWGQTDKLPFDEHWFLALCAPRPFIALEGDTDNVSLPNAVKQSILAARPAYEFLQAQDRLGVNYAHHGHAFTAGGLDRDAGFRRQASAGPADGSQIRSVPARSRLAVERRHTRRRITFAGRDAFRRDRVDGAEVLGAQRDVEGAQVLVEIRAALGAGDRDDALALRQHPGERELRRRAALLARDLLDARARGRGSSAKFSPWKRGEWRR